MNMISNAGMIIHVLPIRVNKVNDPVGDMDTMPSTIPCLPSDRVAVIFPEGAMIEEIPVFAQRATWRRFSIALKIERL